MEKKDPLRDLGHALSTRRSGPSGSRSKGRSVSRGNTETLDSPTPRAPVTPDHGALAFDSHLDRVFLSVQSFVLVTQTQSGLIDLKIKKFILKVTLQVYHNTTLNPLVSFGEGPGRREVPRRRGRSSVGSYGPHTRVEGPGPGGRPRLTWHQVVSATHPPVRPFGSSHPSRHLLCESQTKTETK